MQPPRVHRHEMDNLFCFQDIIVGFVSSVEAFSIRLIPEVFSKIIMVPSITGELHPAATCYVYVLWLRNVVLESFSKVLHRHYTYM